MNSPFSIPYELIEQLDDHAVALYFEVPASKTVFLQAIFELSEGLGVVRTVDVARSVISIVTTPDGINDCFVALNALSQEMPWRMIAKPTGDGLHWI